MPSFLAWCRLFNHPALPPSPLYIPYLSTAKFGIAGIPVVEGDHTNGSRTQIAIGDTGDKLLVDIQVQHIALSQHGQIVALLYTCVDGSAQTIDQRSRQHSVLIEIERIGPVDAHTK